MTEIRRLYLHLDDPNSKVTFRIRPLAREDRSGGATHSIEFRDGYMFTRTWVDCTRLKLRRDLLGWYFADYRRHGGNDKIYCTRAMRDEVSKIRPEVSFCPWRPLGDDE